MLKQLQKDLRKLENLEKAKFLAGYFKTRKGEYGEGDIFLGLKVPQTRAVAYKYLHNPFADLKSLIKSKIHEERQALLMILGRKFKKASDSEQKQIYEFYLANTKYINNWDLIDGSSELIVGAYLENSDKNILTKLAKSWSIWERRIAVLATFHYIKQGKFGETLRLAKILIDDRHDLIQKAVGWMLREIGNRDQKVEEEFLKKYYKIMPRTILRYAIEKFSEDKRKFYLNKSHSGKL